MMEKTNSLEFGVADLSRHLKRMVEENFGSVRVRGEIGECKLHSSGHLYLSLKEASAVLSAVCWRGSVSKLSIRPETGMDVICTGRLTTYEGQSKYQMIVERMELAGEGALLKLLEERKKKLASEGLFDASRKKALPFLPLVIGVITSPTGAVIRDILHRLSDRFPCRVLMWPVAVQGEGAAVQIAAAIRGMNALPSDTPRPDVLIVARGGGSLEDLMPFNEEEVVRAAAESKIPLISAVGHETDTTLIDYVSDRRAPTPTAAAEIAVPVRDDLLMQVLDDGTRLEAALQRTVHDKAAHLKLLGRAIGDPDRILEPLVQRFDERTERLQMGIRAMVERSGARLAQASLRHPRELLQLAGQRLQNTLHKLQALGRERLFVAEKRVERAGAMLEALSPHAVLGRGYSLVYDASGKPVTAGKKLKKADKISIAFQDGTRAASIED